MSKRIDATGKQYGFYTVLEYVGGQRYKCRCVCGTIKNLRRNDLEKRPTVSCGCKAAESISLKNRTHGKGKTKVYRAWCNIKRRCNDPNNNRYPLYGARGIKVCDGWQKDFMAFYEHIGDPPTPKHSIDRIDVNGNYEPGNVRWAGPIEQANNTRCNVFIEYGGERLTLAEWSRKLNLNYGLIPSRLRKGWDIEQALFTPLPTRKLTDEEIREIITAPTGGKIVAKKYGVSCSLIRKIRNGEEGYAEFF